MDTGKNKVSAADSNDDYIDGIHRLGPFADYLVVNISSPNTPGLRALQKKDMLDRLVKDIMKARNELPKTSRPPLLVKIAPDLDDQELKDIAEIIQQNKVDGVIISNTTISRPSTLQSNQKHETGGLSGKPLKPLSLRCVARFHQLTNGTIPIIGCGGIASGPDAVDMLEAGASCVQVYTAFAYQGPGLVQEIKDHLGEVCKQRGLNSVMELRGVRVTEFAK
jgi:dihydroorotate dehydrogenase